MNTNHTCFFSGHRDCCDTPELRRRITHEIEHMAAVGVATFISGGALGFDTICAEQVQHLKETCDYPIALEFYLPCFHYDSRWNERDYHRMHHLRARADKVIYVTSSEYVPDCMKRRNYAMVDASEYGIVYYDPGRFRSGTGQTVRYAVKQKKTILNIFE